MTTAVDKSPAYARLAAVAPAGDLPTAPTPRSGTRPRSAYEGHAILDFVAENRSALQPTTVHSDTHGQSAPIFGLASLLGIELMPRIRSWQDLHLFRPDATARYDHINDLFTATVDWPLIEAHLPDMLCVALSIRAGKLLPSAILRRLATYSRKNRLYFAFRELGRAVRTDRTRTRLCEPAARILAIVLVECHLGSTRSGWRSSHSLCPSSPPGA